MHKGTVSGVIKDKHLNTLAGCFVGLYKITGTEETKIETLTSVTKTNGSGQYLFSGVEEGSYIVKAKK